MRIAIVGGTGTFGRALAERITMLGESVVIGSRDAARASEIAAVLGVEGATNEEAVRNADLVILAVRSNAALETARALAPAIGTTPLLSVASALEFTDDGIAPGQHGYSLAEEIERHRRRPHRRRASVARRRPPHRARTRRTRTSSSAATPSAAKDLTLELAGRLVKGRAIDAGPLANARALEGMTAVILNVNKRYKAHAGIRLTGLE